MEKRMNDKQMWELFDSLTEMNDYTVAFFQQIPKKYVEENEELLDKHTKEYGTWFDDSYSGFEKGYYYFAQRGPLKSLKNMLIYKPHMKNNIILACIENNKGDKYINEKY